MITNWKSVIKNPVFRKEMFFSALIGIFIIVFVPKFMLYIQNRNGNIIDDYLLTILPAKDVSLFLFMIMYGMIIFALVYTLSKPLLFLKGIQTYLLVISVRLLCIFLVPLEPPLNVQLLSDPLMDNFLGASENPITKDLFFSGHTATAFLLYLLMDRKLYRILFLLCTVLIGILLLIQHIHYTVDIVVAPFVTWVSYQLISRRFYKFRQHP